MSVRRAQDERIEGTPDGLNQITEIVDVPDAPTVGTPTDVGTSRAYNNAAASVPVTANVTGGTPATYTVTSSPGGFSASGTSPVTVTGLNSQTSYTFTATATNSTGTQPTASAASSSVIVTSVPATPSAPTATDQGSSRPYNNGQASVAFTAPSSGGKTISTYTVTPTPATSPTTFTGASSPITVTGLSSATAYTYTVSATNANGTGGTSSASSAVTATTVPQAPTIGTATVSGLTASVPFTAGATGGSAITGYTATSSPGGITGTGASSPITVSGLTGGTAYTFTVTATNANGTSAASSASNSVTPISYFFARINSGGTNDTGHAICSDSSGNIYVSGMVSPGGTVYSYYAKLTSAGAISWQRYRAMPSGYGNPYTPGVGVDSSGNVYFAGKTATGAKGQQVSLVKYNSSGTLQWSKDYGSIYADYIGNMVVDSSGNCYITDNATETGGESVTVVVNSSGTVTLQKRTGFAAGDGGIGSVKGDVDSSGNTYTFGKSSSNFGIAKVNSSGTMVWSRVYSTSNSAYLGSIGMGKVDSSGNVYVGVPWASTGQGILVKYNSSGTLQWDRWVHNSVNYSLVRSIAVDSSGYVYVLFVDGQNTNSLYIRKFDSSGTSQWIRKLSSTSQLTCSWSGNTLFIDSNNIMYITGSMENDLFVAKLPTDGSKTGTYSLGGATLTYASDTSTNTSPGNTDSAAGFSTSNPSSMAIQDNTDTITTSAYTPTIVNA